MHSFVFGNESCDLDSIVSSIAFGKLFSNESHIITPVINHTNRRILRMHPEIVKALAKADINIDDIMDLNNKQLIDNVYLVDHNELSIRWNWIPKNIIGIIDHHEDCGNFSSANPRIIKTCGSCASLVTIFAKENSSSFDNIENDKIKELLLMAICFDTCNFTLKCTDIDIKAAQSLLKNLKENTKEEIQKHCKEMYKELKKEDKETVFPIEDLLLSDLKLYRQNSFLYGISVIIDQKILSNDDINDSFNDDYDNCELVQKAMKFKKMENLKLYIVIDRMGEREIEGNVHLKENIKKRIILIFHKIHQNIIEFLNNHGYKTRLIKSANNYGIYEQDNLEFTRKQLQPLLKSYISKYSI